MSVCDRTPRASRLAAALTALLALGAWLPACAAAEPQAEAAKNDPNRVLATVDGQPITEAQVRQEAPDRFRMLEQQLAQCKAQYEKGQHEVLESSLEQVVQDRMIDAEAKAKGVSKEEYLKTEAGAAEATDADADKFYEENKARIPRPLDDQLRGQIKQYLTAQRQQEARQKLMAQLEGKHEVSYKLEPQRVEVAATGPAKGPDSAPVTIVEFSDFQCPYCARLAPTLDQVVANYGDKVRLVFRQFPLDMHPDARKAAEAALCANEQGKFWQLHDAMFQNQQQLAVDALKTKATELGLNGEQFNACLDSGKYGQQVTTDLQAGSQAGVSGTPALFVNGRFINGAVPYEEIAKVINDELKRKGVATASK
ncbi:MAG: thioredoxin domain-containing protein, partial [Thermoanaerobaculia bacterium]